MLRTHFQALLSLFLIGQPKLVTPTPIGAEYHFDRSVFGNFGFNPFQAPPAEPSTDIAVSQNHEQIATITVGTPPQLLRCLIDSGSSDLWVPSRKCQSCASENTFLADASSTFQPEINSGQPRIVQINYGSGTIKGYAVKDTVRFGSVTIQGQSFVIVEDEQLPPGRPWDGICGLGWSGLAQSQPLYTRLHEQGIPALVALVPGAAGPLGAVGPSVAPVELILGSIPQDAIKPNTLQWAQAEKENSGFLSQRGRSFWIISGGAIAGRAAPMQARFLVDTGTNQAILVPQKHYQSFIQSLLPPAKYGQSCGMDPRTRKLVCDCSAVQDESLPAFGIQFGAAAMMLPLGDLFLRVPSAQGGELCLLQVGVNYIQSSPSSGIGGLLNGLFSRRLQSEAEVKPRRLQLFGGAPDELWMVGGVFLEHFVTIYDFDNARVGFAQRAQTMQGSPLSNAVGLSEEPHGLASDLMTIGMFHLGTFQWVCSSALLAIFISAAVLGLVMFAIRHKRGCCHNSCKVTDMTSTPILLQADEEDQHAIE